ncbi:trimeric intracellular cation channel family protein [Anaerovorax odorimutans]|uniref:trimeric intracellular cation channel family protein n=1 Tax=Anaerovorax odorimutans TaxID=109327 RepID=UPI00042A51AC|nr:trimeric intracellular cation channel family protein [Anaerovorax odorimutans]
MYFISGVELIGTVAFAVTGALVAIEKNLDYYGIAFFSAVTAVGGGIVRDMMINKDLSTALENPVYVILSLISAIFVIVFYKKINKLNNIIQFFDAVGLAAFTAIGAEVAVKNNLDMPFVVVTLSLLTGTGGGILRDVFAIKIPFVFKKEIYAVASIIGAICFIFIYLYLGNTIALYSCFGITLIIRLICIKKDIHLKKVSKV